MSALIGKTKTARVLRFVIAGVWLLAGLAGVAPAQTAGANAPDEATAQLLSIAQSQHEIVQLLIQRGDFKRAMQEFRVILDLRLPVRFEDAVMKEVIIVAKKLYDRGQKDLAYQVLELGGKQLQTVESKARILNVKAGLLKLDGRIEEAIETYRAEVDLRENGLDR